MLKACKACNKLTEASTCPVCQGHDLSSRWSGLVIIINPQDSEVAEKLEITEKGEYALIVQ